MDYYCTQFRLQVVNALMRTPLLATFRGLLPYLTDRGRHHFIFGLADGDISSLEHLVTYLDDEPNPCHVEAERKLLSFVAAVAKCKKKEARMERTFAKVVSHMRSWRAFKTRALDAMWTMDVQDNLPYHQGQVNAATVPESGCSSSITTAAGVISGQADNNSHGGMAAAATDTTTEKVDHASIENNSSIHGDTDRSNSGVLAAENVIDPDLVSFMRCVTCSTGLMPEQVYHCVRRHFSCLNCCSQKLNCGKCGAVGMKRVIRGDLVGKDNSYAYKVCSSYTVQCRKCKARIYSFFKEEHRCLRKNRDVKSVSKRLKRLVLKKGMSFFMVVEKRNDGMIRAKGNVLLPANMTSSIIGKDDVFLVMSRRNNHVKAAVAVPGNRSGAAAKYSLTVTKKGGGATRKYQMENVQLLIPPFPTSLGEDDGLLFPVAEAADERVFFDISLAEDA